MNYSCFSGGPINANCYIVRFFNCGYIIDPCVSLDIIKRELGALPLAGVILTHGHGDHICSLKEVVDYYNSFIYCSSNAVKKIESSVANYSAYMGKAFSFKLKHSLYRYIDKDQEVIDEYGNKINFYITPGHSNCSICIKIDNFLFTGDTVFKGCIGRYDLYTGSESEILESIDKIKNIEGFDVINPGHGDNTTILEEIKNNPYFK